MGITIKQIAADLKLSVSTVSKALADSYEISAETKSRILDYVKKLDYVPNTYASNLKKRKTGNIAVVVPEVADSYFATAINGIEEVAQVKGYHVIIYITHEDQLKEQSILRDFRSGRVDGVLISVSTGQSGNNHLHDLFKSNVPLVFFDRVCEEIATAKVVTDDFDSGYKATALLLKKNCREVVFISMAENLSIIQHRLNGYRAALADHGLDEKNENIIRCSSDERSNHLLMTKLLQRRNRPDGIIASTEKLATLTYHVCRELGLAIPETVKVVGFSSMAIASLLYPSLTTITQPAFEMGKMAASLLFKRLESKKTAGESETFVIESVLHERNSTA